MTTADDLTTATARIKADHEHGASYLARLAAQALADACAPSTESDESAEQRLAAVEAHVRQLAEARPSMAAVANTVAAIWSAGLGDDTGTDAEKRLARMHEAATEIVARWSDAAERILRYARSLLLSPLFTFSRSGTVEHVLGALAREGGLHSLWVARSFPGDEGLAMAESLASSIPSLDVTVIADAACGVFIRNAKAVVVGADTIGYGGVVNKVGTYPLALVAREKKVPVYVLCETLKITGGHVLQIESMDPREVVPDPKPNLSGHNPYFEVTPYDLISAIITEEGVLDRAAIGARARLAQEALARLPRQATAG